MKHLFDDNWKFHPGDIPVPALSGPIASKAGYGRGGADPEAGDASWRTLSLPHDWAIESDPAPWNLGEQGHYPRGIAWYRKSFKLPADSAGKKIFLEFEGIGRNAEAWINGFYLGRHPSGYTPFWCDITDFVPRWMFQECDDPKPDGREEVIAVRVDARETEGWWYEGCGLYRHVWLHLVDRLHFAPYGLWWTTPEVSDKSARVEVHARVRNEHEAARRFCLSVAIAGADAAVEEQVDAELQPGEERTFVVPLVLPSPRRWSPETPHLYEVNAAIAADGATADTARCSLGIREFRFDPDAGFILNGKPYKLQGVNCHQDFAGVGVALPDRLHEKRVELLKGMGCNAFRCGHNPPATAFLDACDRLGLLVMDENRKLDTTPEGEADLRLMIRRDRAHPSVFCWSLCNEEFALTRPLGVPSLKTLARMARQEDATRPLAFAGNYFSDGRGTVRAAAVCVDVAGRNYSLEAYEAAHGRYPKDIMLSTEFNAVDETRGVYDASRPQYHALSFIDKPLAPIDSGWWPDGLRPTTLKGCVDSWKTIAERDWIAGGFLWTGMDYRGECRWPHTIVGYGAMDLCGFPKDSYYYFKAWWKPQEPLLHVFPHWTWPGLEGKPVWLRVFGNCEEVDLLVNGASLGKRAMPRCAALEWETVYQPGTVTAVGYRGGKEVCRVEQKTAGEPARIELTSDRRELVADGRDVACITARLVDSAGTLVPHRRPEIRFAVEGAGRLLGCGNGDPLDHTLDASPDRTPFGGLCLAIVQAAALPGVIAVRADADGLAAGERACLSVLPFSKIAGGRVNLAVKDP